MCVYVCGGVGGFVCDCVCKCETLVDSHVTKIIILMCGQYTCVCVRVCAFACVCVHSLCIYVNMHARVYACAYTRVCVCVHLCT